VAQGDLNTTSYVILGLLASRDWSAYEIAAQVGRGVAEVWPRAERQRLECWAEPLGHLAGRPGH